MEVGWVDRENVVCEKLRMGLESPEVDGGRRTFGHALANSQPDA
jgi:hypothetical protein